MKRAATAVSVSGKPATGVHVRKAVGQDPNLRDAAILASRLSDDIASRLGPLSFLDETFNDVLHGYHLDTLLNAEFKVDKAISKLAGPALDSR